MKEKMKSCRDNEKLATGERPGSRHGPEVEIIGFVGPPAARDQRKGGLRWTLTFRGQRKQWHHQLGVRDRGKSGTKG